MTRRRIAARGHRGRRAELEAELAPPSTVAADVGELADRASPAWQAGG